MDGGDLCVLLGCNSECIIIIESNNDVKFNNVQSAQVA